jgi:hypothetical protein
MQKCDEVEIEICAKLRQSLPTFCHVLEPHQVESKRELQATAISTAGVAAVLLQRFSPATARALRAL